MLILLRKIYTSEHLKKKSFKLKVNLYRKNGSQNKSKNIPTCITQILKYKSVNVMLLCENDQFLLF